jgi:hypothetical protein
MKARRQLRSVACMNNTALDGAAPAVKTSGLTKSFGER